MKKIVEIEERLKFQLAIKVVWVERGDDNFLRSARAEQQKTIDSAVKQMGVLQSNYENATSEIKKADKKIAKIQKEIARWNYRSEIKKLQSAMKKLEELENEDHTNQEG